MSAADVVNEIARESRKMVLVCAKDVQPEDVRWVWPGRLARGKIAVIDGGPGIGKTTIAMDLIARATRGSYMPGEMYRTAPTIVLIASVEDGWADTIRPRLDAAGADLERVHFVTIANSGVFTVPDDVALLADAIRTTGAGWVHIDAIMGALASDVRTGADHDVRRALGPLKDMAEAEDALVTLIRHPRKAGALSAVDAGGGSTAFSALARVVLFAGFDPSDSTEDMNQRRRILAVAKCNLAQTADSLVFRLESAPNGRPSVSWGDSSPITADELASAPMRGVNSARGDEAETRKNAALDWLEDILAGGSRLSLDHLKAEARHAGLSWRTVERAASELGVSKVRGATVGACGAWYLADRPAIVAPSALHTEEDGGTVNDGATDIRPVPPTVPPCGATGGTVETEPPHVPPVAVPPTALIQGSDGGTDEDAPRRLLPAA